MSAASDRPMRAGRRGSSVRDWPSNRPDVKISHAARSKSSTSPMNPLTKSPRSIRPTAAADRLRVVACEPITSLFDEPLIRAAPDESAEKPAVATVCDFGRTSAKQSLGRADSRSENRPADRAKRTRRRPPRRVVGQCRARRVRRAAESRRRARRRRPLAAERGCETGHPTRRSMLRSSNRRARRSSPRSPGRCSMTAPTTPSSPQPSKPPSARRRIADKALVRQFAMPSVGSAAGSGFSIFAETARIMRVVSSVRIARVSRRIARAPQTFRCSIPKSRPSQAAGRLRSTAAPIRARHRS